jgi:hypothetical protein
MSTPTEPLAIWKRLTTAERNALTMMRNGNFLYRSRGTYRGIGATQRVKLQTIRKLRVHKLVHDQHQRKDMPLMLTPLGVTVLDAGENRKQTRQHKAERERVIRASRAAYQTAMDSCGTCVNGYTANCPTPDQCVAPNSGCARCITRCTSCYETEGETV